MMTSPDLPLAAEFSTPQRSDWLDAVDNVLRGRRFEDVLVSSTADGLEIEPLYGEPDVAFPASPVPIDADRVRLGWDVRQSFDASDADACSSAVETALNAGVTSVELTAPRSGWTSEALDVITQDVLFDVAAVVLAPHCDAEAAALFHRFILDRSDGESTRSWLGLDPIGEWARSGESAGVEMVAAVAELVTSLPYGRTLTVDTTRYADAGATEVQQLAWSLSTGVAYLRGLEQAGVSVSEAAGTIGFRLAVGADQFVTTATLRAARRLWARVLEVCGVADQDRVQLQQAVTQRSMFSRRDPWVNMLRATTAAFGAGVGGADAITVLPFDDAIGEPDKFARRVARNAQLLLIEESHVARVVDPAAGSWFVESLTDRLAVAAWERFQALEAAGGIEPSLADGRIRAEIDEAWTARLSRLGTRVDRLTGVSEFPILDEQPITRPSRAVLDGLPIRRLAAPFEDLRDAADRHLATTGNRPLVHLSTLGDLADHSSRATWITNLVAAGGVAVSGGDGDGSYSPLQAAARFEGSGATIAIICSSDAVYGERAKATATALREAGAIRVVLAGRPGKDRDDLAAAGVDEYWHDGIDVLDVLGRLHADLDV